MLRNDHEIMIEQESSWTILRLIDKQESKANGGFITGTWKHTDKSYNDTEIKFTSSHPQHLYFEWYGGIKTLLLGVKMNSISSHKEGEEPYFQRLIQMTGIDRTAMSQFKVMSVLKSGTGLLTYNVNPHFKAGEMLWTPIRYER